MVQAHAEQDQLAFGKLDQIGGTGLADEADDGVGSFLLGVDELIDAKFLGAEDKVGGGEFGVADAGDGGFDTQLLGHSTGEQVDLVVGGHGGDEIYLLDADPAQVLQTSAIALGNDDVELFADALDATGVGVNLGNIVPVLAQLLAQLEADGAGTYDQNVHGF